MVFKKLAARRAKEGHRRPDATSQLGLSPRWRDPDPRLLTLTQVIAAKLPGRGSGHARNSATKIRAQPLTGVEEHKAPNEL